MNEKSVITVAAETSAELHSTRRPSVANFNVKYLSNLIHIYMDHGELVLGKLNIVLYILSINLSEK